MSHLNLLCLETSTELCSVAIWKNKQIFLKEQLAANKHTQLILPMIDNLLQTADLKLQDLNGIAFGKGPGSFTGLRVAAAVTEGISFGLNLKIYGISTLHTLAMGLSFASIKEQLILATIDARMNEIYWALYYKAGDNVLQTVIAEQVSTFSLLKQQLDTYCQQNNYKFADLIACGSGMHAYQQEFIKNGITISDFLYPSARYIAEIAAIDLHSVVPKYLLPMAIPTYIRNKITQ